MPLAVERMRILNNRNFQEAANQFERVHAVVSPDVTTGPALSYPVLSPEPMILVEDRPGADELMVTFEKLARTERRDVPGDGHVRGQGDARRRGARVPELPRPRLRRVPQRAHDST